MNLSEIKQAVADNKTVHWANDGYVVTDGGIAGHLITFTSNNDSIGLTHRDGVTLNGDETDFYIKEPERNYSGRATEGNKYQDTKDLDVKDIAKLIRADLKAVNIKASVRIERYSMGKSINVDIITPEEFTVKNPAFDHNIHPAHMRLTDEAKTLRDKVTAIVEAYNYDDSDSQIDYFDVNFYSHIGFKSCQ